MSGREYALVLFTDKITASSAILPCRRLICEPGETKIQVNWHGCRREGIVLQRHADKKWLERLKSSSMGELNTTRMTRLASRNLANADAAHAGVAAPADEAVEAAALPDPAPAAGVEAAAPAAEAIDDAALPEAAPAAGVDAAAPAADAVERVELDPTQGRLIKLRHADNARAMVRALLTELVGVDELKTMTVYGKTRPGIPKKVLDFIQNFVIDHSEQALTNKEYTECIKYFLKYLRR